MTIENEQSRAEQIDDLLFRAYKRMREGNTAMGLRLLRGLMVGYNVPYDLVQGELSKYITNGLLPRDFTIPADGKSFLIYVESLAT